MSEQHGRRLCLRARDVAWGWGLAGFLKNALLVLRAPREHRG